jgi:6-phosphogluconolactonase (cycloisomerase 2 family)
MSSITSLQGKRRSIALRDNLHGFGATRLASSRSASVSYPGGGSGFLDGSKLLYYTSSGLTSGAISNIVSTSSDFTVTHSIGVSIPSAGRYVLIAGCSTSGYNNIWEVSSSTSSTCVISCPLNLGTPTTKGTLYFFGAGVLNETQSNVIISENGSFLTADTNDSLVMLYKTSGYIVPRVDVTAKMYLMAGGGSGGGSGRGYSSYTLGTTASGSTVSIGTSTSSSYSHIVKHPTASVVFITNDKMYSTTLSGVKPYSISASGVFTAKTVKQIGTTSQAIMSMCIDPAGKYLYFLNRTAHTVHLGTIDQTTYEVTVSATSYTTNLSGYTATTPYHAQVDRTGKFLFVLCIGNSTSSAGIAVFTINQTDGTLTSASFTTITNLPSYSVYAAGNLSSGKIAVHPTLNKIYCAAAALYGFNYYSYDGTTGALTFISRWDYGNTAAAVRSVAINATGTALVVGGVVSSAGSVWPFSLDSSTGDYTVGTRSGGGGSGVATNSHTIFDPTGFIILQPSFTSASSPAYVRHWLYTPSTNTAAVQASVDREILANEASTAVIVNGCVVFVGNSGYSTGFPAAQSYTISVTTADTYGGGGGAGAMSGYNGTNTYTLLANNIYQLSVGAGGAGSTGSGSNGTNSVLTNLTAGSTVYTASGGGKGGSPGSVNGSTGGCGGGGSGSSAGTATTGGTSDSSFYAGGAGSSLGGQGGGLSLAGGDSGSMSATGVINVGTALSSLYYHFGGGGFAGVTINNNGFPLSQYLYGAGIGQYGIPSVFTSMSAAANTGSGGGGTAYLSASGTGAAGGNGGSGFLLIQITK